ncbi:MAG: NUDIX hydrolase [Phycisphaerales bacterium]|nr:MAG: NUDIX hydrolase [Phycisphaerales bacterium]
MDASDEAALSFREVSREVLHRGRKFDFERVTLRDGTREIEREMVRHPGAVCVLPLLETPEGVRVVFVRNERFTVGRRLLELPAGTIEPGEAPLVCAGRELIEETGYEALRLEPMGSFLTTPGMTDERMHAFVATGLRHVGQRLEEDERMTVELLGVEAALERAGGGAIEDGKTVCTLLLAARRGLLGRV